MGGETRGGRINGVVTRQGSSVYKQKQEFDDRITMFRLEKNIYRKIIAECPKQWNLHMREER